MFSLNLFLNTTNEWKYRSKNIWDAEKLDEYEAIIFQICFTLFVDNFKIQLFVFYLLSQLLNLQDANS